ncbi:MAG: LytR C-terminal domain-containing protein [Gordonia sp. (in: high G+C Gram-positive bacteria)]|uniref:LytR C-terminal domain-containing protein n=1 Tax=Gordonia sp. (in: high G+C Gram-positive bacteria) TaxID=84139 RepID=UPI0039E509F9
MSTERESNRLPLRAGAMLLLAVAVVFFGLGIHHLVTGGGDDTAGPAASTTQAPVQSTPAAPPAAGQPGAAGEPSAPPSTAAAKSTKVCVINAGEVKGLATTITDQLKAKGYQTEEPGNLSSSSMTENTIFYLNGQKAAADEVAGDLGGSYSVEARPAGATKLPECSGVLVIAVNQ